nr:entericidin EcnA/B family protein [Litoreibacter meonggei]
MITRLSLIGLALVFALAGCETVDGIGQDVSGAARAVKRAL